MDNVTFKLNPDFNDINWDKLTDLFELVAWGHRPANEIRAAFEQSSVSYFIYDKNELIGFGRTVDDGKYYALLVDVVIHPKYQIKGLGKILIEKLRLALKGFEFITLTAAPGKAGFYHKIGWLSQSSSFIFPKDEKQKREHCKQN